MKLLYRIIPVPRSFDSFHLLRMTYLPVDGLHLPPQVRGRQAAKFRRHTSVPRLGAKSRNLRMKLMFKVIPVPRSFGSFHSLRMTCLSVDGLHPPPPERGRQAVRFRRQRTVPCLPSPVLLFVCFRRQENRPPVPCCLPLGYPIQVDRNSSKDS